jgi:hypothetical protein
VADGHGSAGSSGSGCCGGIFYIPGRNTTDEPTANLVGSFQLPSGKRPGPGDGNARTVVLLSFGLAQPQNSLCAVGRPSGDETSIGFADRQAA